MIELGIFLAGFVVGGVVCYRWGRKDAAADAPVAMPASSGTVSPDLSGGPREPA